MKKLTVICLVLALSSAAAWGTVETLEEAQLKPSADQRYASRLATRFISSYNFPRTQLDKELSSRIFDQYLQLLDPGRNIFLAADIEQFERYRNHLDEALKNAELEPAYDIFNRFIQRYGERTEYANTLLDQGFDFTVDEHLRLDRSDAAWADDVADLDEFWRKQVKNDWLRLRLADQDDDEILTTLKRRYKSRLERVKGLDANDVFAYFMNAFAGSVEPHSAYMSPQDADNFEITMSLSLEGIGAELERDLDSEFTTVRRVLPGGPAELDGRLKSGDRIVAVGQQDDEEATDVVGWRLDEVVELIRGPKETQVRLEILPADSGLSGPPEIIDLVRGEVQLEEQAASSEIIETDNDSGHFKIGVISVPAFYVDFADRARNRPNYRSTTRDVRHLINDLREEKVDGIAIDLRGNGGGALTEATTMTGLFIDEGPVVQVRDRTGNITTEADREPGMAWDGPLAVLVDRRSASASEIFAAAIQDYGRGVIIGETTYGKGTVQNLINLDEFGQGDRRMGQLRLTMAQFYRVTGGSTQSKGVMPDIELPYVGDPEEIGESALDFALPWNQIDPTEFQPVARLEDLIVRARHGHEARRTEDQELSDLITELAEWEKFADRESLSLMESVRREEMDEREALREARLGEDTGDDDAEADAESNDGDDAESDGADGDTAGDDDAPDTLLTESVRILADLIGFDRDLHLLAHQTDRAALGESK